MKFLILWGTGDMRKQVAFRNTVPITVLSMCELPEPVWVHISGDRKVGLLGTCRKCAQEPVLQSRDLWAWRPASHVTCGLGGQPVFMLLRLLLPLFCCGVLSAFSDPLFASGP